jgi:hypothetical protein
VAIHASQGRSARKGPLLHQRASGRVPGCLAASVVGIKHLMMRDLKMGKFERITGDAKQIDKALKMKNAFWIYTKDPNVQP